MVEISVSQTEDERPIRSRATVAVAELAMQRIVVPRDESLYAGSNPVSHPDLKY